MDKPLERALSIVSAVSYYMAKRACAFKSAAGNHPVGHSGRALMVAS